MKVTDHMIYTFAGESEITATDAHAIGVGLQAVLDMPEMQALERFARAAAASVVTDGVDEWNGLVDAWDALPADVSRMLLEPR